MVEAPLLVALLWLAYPLWLAAGWIDCRRQRTAGLSRTSGEAAWHVLLLAPVGLGLLAALAFSPTHALLLVLAMLATLHLLASVADPRRAGRRARAGGLARHAHSLFDLLPLLGLALYVALHWAGTSDLASADWSLRLREPAPSTGVWIAVLAPALAFAAWSGWLEFRHARRAATA